MTSATKWVLGIMGVGVGAAVVYGVAVAASAKKASSAPGDKPKGIIDSVLEVIKPKPDIVVTEIMLAGQGRGVLDVNAGLPARIPANYVGNADFEIGYTAGYTGKPFGEGTL